MTLPQWHPEVEVSEQLARALIDEQFAQLRPVALEHFGTGWDNAAFMCNGRYVFRFPQRAVAAPLIEMEAAILPLIASELPASIPVPRFRGTSARSYPWAFAGYEMLAGQTGCSLQLDATIRSNLAAPLANFLRRLHTIDPSEAIQRGLPPDTLGRMDHEKRLPATLKRFAELQDAGLIDNPASFLEAMQRISPINGEGKKTIVHGDLYARHVLIENGKLSGVIDWGDMHLGNPAIDLRIAFLMLPPDAHKTFRDEYGSIDERTWQLSMYSAIYSAVMVLHYGNRINDAHLVASGMTALEYINFSL